MKTGTATRAEIEFAMAWESGTGRHEERLFAGNVNFYRDLFPEAVQEALSGRSAGETVSTDLTPEEAFPDRNRTDEREVRIDDFSGKVPGLGRIEPRLGRFYPQGFVRGLPGVFRANRVPMRIVGLNGRRMRIDLGHPLAGRRLHLSATVQRIRAKAADRGGTSNVWLDNLADGSGMQVRADGSPTDFFSDSPFARADETGDALFYETPRLVRHMDDTALSAVSELYGRLIPDGGNVLDLMASWETYVPAEKPLAGIAGLGLNRAELDRNSRLSRRVVHDLNQSPDLPFPDASFDAVVINASVEYLTDPFAVFADVARVLKPGGVFVATFTDRWFPTKAIRIWPELHEFERMGLVSEYFLRSGMYRGLNTLSIRGRMRPETDRYFPERPLSDPVFAVWAYRRKEDSA